MYDRVIVLDIEADNVDPYKIENIWCVCTEELYSGVSRTFTDPESFKKYIKGVDGFIGHNIISYDAPALSHVWNIHLPINDIIDTLVLSRLDDVRREGGHSLQSWGSRLGHPKTEWSDWSKLSDDMIKYCKNDVRLTTMLYGHLKNKLSKFQCKEAIAIEQRMVALCDEMTRTGFKFDILAAQALEREISEIVGPLEDEILSSFEPNVEILKTKTKVTPFNPNSAKQVIDRIHLYWSPTEKTKGHLDAEKVPGHPKLEHFKKYGWTLSEKNFSTLSEDAPLAAKLFVKYRLYQSRLMKLREWFGCYNPETGRVHGQFQSIGTWTGRMVHTSPNLANIAAEKSIKYKTEELKNVATDLGKRMRQFFKAEDDAYLVGVDLEGIQLRVLAHYLKNKEFSHAVVSGKKDNKTDIHSLNCSALDTPGCDRDRAKTFIYAFLLGAGLPKIAQILGCASEMAKAAYDRFIKRYEGLEELKRKTAVKDAKRGYFTGLDGRPIRCDSAHHMLAAYLQAGEAIIMKKAVLLAYEAIKRNGIPAKLINIVHDECLWEVTGKDNSIIVKDIVINSMREAGEFFKMSVPISGEGKVGKNWQEVH